MERSKVKEEQGNKLKRGIFLGEGETERGSVKCGWGKLRGYDDNIWG